MNRQQLRQQMRQARRALSTSQQKTAAKQLAKQLSKLAQIQRAKRIGVYLPADGEISPESFTQWARSVGKQLYLPVLHPVRHNRLWFVEYKRHCRLQRNRYGIMEPNPRYSQRQLVWGLDVVLLPLVAFDALGGRLGMGGGYYDRTFAYRRQLAPYQGPTLIGLAHQLQEVETLEMASWDIPLSAIITDNSAFFADNF